METGVVYAADYDLGRWGYAYHDKDSANYWVTTGKRIAPNRGGEYRNDGVDIEQCRDSLTNGFAVGYTESGEWMRYPVT